MIRSLVESAFQTGCLSVASEGLIGQVLAMKGYQSADLDALANLYNALSAGKIKREATGAVVRRLAEYGQRPIGAMGRDRSLFPLNHPQERSQIQSACTNPQN